MPAILTHDFFGKDAFEIAAGRLGFATLEEQEAFLLGNQGPDPLFFLQADPLLHRWANMGSRMHKARTPELLLSMRDALAPLPLQDVAVARAYCAGFLCHYLLDTTAHPFVFSLQDSLTSMGVEGLDEQAGPLVHTIWRLRQSDGCPWDKAQTHDSITKNMVEEAYEAVEAIKEGSSEHLQEELGDVLEQVLLHSQIESDDGGFDIDDVCRALNEKLVRRHPHVFGPEAGNAHDADAALDAWDSVKAAERANEEDRVHAEGLLDSVPYSLPALMQAQKLSKRVAKVGFDWDSVHDIWQKVAEERAEYEVEAPGSEARAEEFGDLLLSRVRLVGGPESLP